MSRIPFYSVRKGFLLKLKPTILSNGNARFFLVTDVMTNSHTCMGKVLERIAYGGGGPPRADIRADQIVTEKDVLEIYGIVGGRHPGPIQNVNSILTGDYKTIPWPRADGAVETGSTRV